MIPPFLPTSKAAALAAATKWWLFRQRALGKIEPCGRRGRTLIWRTADIERIAQGESLVNGGKPDRRTRTPSRAANANSETALSKLRAIARGGCP